MAKQFIKLLAIMILITGCASPWANMDRGMSSLEGQHIDVAINLIGDPDKTRMRDGSKVYMWTDSVKASENRSTVTSGGIGLVSVPVEHTCTITIATDAAGIINSVVGKGRSKACKNFEKQLVPYADQRGIQ